MKRLLRNNPITSSAAEKRGLLASPKFAGQPVKGVYFFPGERGGNAGLYTAHPLDPREGQWNSHPETRAWVMDRMVQAHINTVVMSYWSNMPQWSPMALDDTSLNGVLDAVRGRPLVIMPAIEGGHDPAHPQIPQWEFGWDFPRNPQSGQVAPGLVERIGQLVSLFKGRMDLWAQLYDRTGRPRYAVHLLHVCSHVLEKTPSSKPDELFASAFDTVAEAVYKQFKIRVGFTLDTIGGMRYSPYPHEAGAALARTDSVLAVQGFASEVFSGLVKNGQPCSDDWPKCQPHDNNKDNLERLADWKRDAVGDWVATGVPVILDVSSGFDGRIVWKSLGTGFWGDNLNYTEDRWRNWLSQLKGSGIRGITFNTWNGYTEGYAAVPTTEHGVTIYNWLRDLMEPSPLDYSHMHYANGKATHRVYGVICEKWIQLGADRRFGAPTGPERPAKGGRVQYFTENKAIFWSGATGAHEVHGLILKSYQRIGADKSKLGLPISDEEATGEGRISRFQHGSITWKPGDAQGVIHIT